MQQRKICMLGAFSVGKTSLVKQFVSSIFDDKYLTTIGVKIDKKVISSKAQETTLMLWDLAGEDAFNKINPSYLRGAAGCILVIDGTRPKTVDVAYDLKRLTHATLGEIPIVAALNKADLKDQWLLDDATLANIQNEFTVIETSARTGENVEAMFQQLVDQMQ